MNMKNNRNILTQYKDAVKRIDYLKTNISRLEEKLFRLTETDYGIVSDVISKGKRGRKSLGTVKITGFRTAEYLKAERELKENKMLLIKKEEELLPLLIKAEECIAEIENIELQNILSLYYIENMTWLQVSHAMNDIYKNRRYTEDGCRQKYKRLFKEYS